MRRFLALALLAPLAACATMTRGTTQAFVVESEPSGAAVTTSTGLSCPATPCTFPRLSREAEFTVTVSMEGYQSSTHNVTHQTSGGGGAGMAGNVILGGLIGVAVDANSGATQELVPNPLRVTLRRTAPPAQATLTSAPVAEGSAEAPAPADPAAAPPLAAAPAPAPAAQ